MFISETVILTEDDKKAPPISIRVRKSGGNYQISPPRKQGTLYVVLDGENVVTQTDTTPLTLHDPPANGFFLAFQAAENFFIGSLGNPDLSRLEVKKAIERRKDDDVNVSYDDYAIAEQNYFPSKPLIHPSNYELICDKGHFLNLQANTSLSNMRSGSL